MTFLRKLEYGPSRTRPKSSKMSLLSWFRITLCLWSSLSSVWAKSQKLRSLRDRIWSSTVYCSNRARLSKWNWKISARSRLNGNWKTSKLCLKNSQCRTPSVSWNLPRKRLWWSISRLCSRWSFLIRLWWRCVILRICSCIRNLCRSRLRLKRSIFRLTWNSLLWIKRICWISVRWKWVKSRNKVWL
jgi:hypothetical protein